MTCKLALLQPFVFVLFLMGYFSIRFTQERCLCKFSGLYNINSILLAIAFITGVACLQMISSTLFYQSNMGRLWLAIMRQLVFNILAFGFFYSQKKPDENMPFGFHTRGHIYLKIFVWWVLGTYMRYKLDIPLLGVWGEVMGIKF